MKLHKILTYVGAAALGLGMMQSAAAITITEDPFFGTNVGQVDKVIAQTGSLIVAGKCEDPGSSEQNEACWAGSVLGMDLVVSGKTEDVKTYSTSEPGVIAFQLIFGPGYYVIKNATQWALIENLSELAWGVIRLSDFGASFNLSEGVVISHVTEFNGTSVPEPGTMALIGAGLLGLALLRRRRTV